MINWKLYWEKFFDHTYQTSQAIIKYIDQRTKKMEQDRLNNEALNDVGLIQQDLTYFFHECPLAGNQKLDIKYPNQILIDVLAVKPKRYFVLLPKACNADMDSLSIKRAIPEMINRNLYSICKELQMIYGQNAVYLHPILFRMKLLNVKDASPSYLGLLIET